MDIDHFKQLVQPALLRLCIVLSIAAILVILLSSLPVLSFLLSLRSPLLLAAIIGWSAIFIIKSLGANGRRIIVSAQGTGGDMLQVATHYAFELAQNMSSRGREDFAEGEQHFRAARYRESAVAFDRVAGENLAAALNVGAALINIADFERARLVLEDGLQRAKSQPHRLLEAALRANSGVLDARQGRLNEALVHYDAAVDVFREEGDARGRGDILLNAANARVHKGDYDGAKRQLSEAVRTHRSSGGLLGQANALACRGYIEVDSDDLEEALKNLKKAGELYGRARSHSGQAHALMLTGNVHFKNNNLSDALATYEKTSVLCQQAGDPLGEASALVNIGNVHFKQGDSDSALRDYEEALEVHVKAGNVLGQARTLTNMGSALARQHKSNEALQAMEQAQALYQRVGAKGRIVDTVDQVIARIKRRKKRVERRGKKGRG
ncbi:MAG: tetratricopeptide repeat protein [Candidatus Latescibacterota bacterium]